jgi:protein CpxP
MKSIHEDSSLSPQDRRAKMRSLWEDSDTKIKAVLNDDQKQKYDQMQQQRRERMQQRRQDQGENNPQSH